MSHYRNGNGGGGDNGPNTSHAKTAISGDSYVGEYVETEFSSTRPLLEVVADLPRILKESFGGARLELVAIEKAPPEEFYDVSPTGDYWVIRIKVNVTVLADE